MIMQARRLRRQYGIYSLDPTQPPVAIQLLLKVNLDHLIMMNRVLLVKQFSLKTKTIN